MTSTIETLRSKNPRATIGCGPHFDLIIGTQLAEVINPFGSALIAGCDINLELRNDPNSNVLAEFVTKVEASIRSAIAEGFDGICYRLVGADIAHSTPMWYGGILLEADRALLAMAVELGTTVLVIDGGAEAFIDVTSDLPAHIFAWDSELTGVSDADVRSLRSGYTASADAESDFSFLGSSALSQIVEKQFCGSI